MDVTSDDPIVKGGNGYGWGNLCNQYLNLTDAQMGEDHWWEPVEGAACTAKDLGPEAVEQYIKLYGRG